MGSSPRCKGVQGTAEGPTRDELGLVAGRYHSLVHGDPQAAQETLIALDDGSPGFTVSKDLDSPERADAVAFEATMYLVVLMARSAELFPEAT